MKISPDTNVLIRGVVRDDVAQTRAADKVFKEATTLAVSLHTLCEFVWVLRSTYGFCKEDVSAAMKALVNIPKVSVNRQAVEAGLAILQTGGDFADGVIAFEGRLLGGETFVSFDKRAVQLLAAQGYSAKLLR